MNRTAFYAKKIAALYGFEKGLFFYVYAQLHRGVFQRWYAYLDDLSSCVSSDARIRLVMRPAYRYLRAALTAVQKTAILTFYYNALTTRFSPSGLASFLGQESHLMAQLTGKSGRTYALYLLLETTKDGALKFQLMDTQLKACLAKMTGTPGVDKDGRAVFWIGSIQGSNPPTGKEDIAHATRDLNSLRPKQAVFYAACALAEWFGAEKMLAPGLKNQVAMKVFYRKHKIYNDYNSFWEEFAPMSADGDYHIPLPLPRRQASEVPSKRRKDWLLRYERIDAMAAGIKEKLNSFCA